MASSRSSVAALLLLNFLTCPICAFATQAQSSEVRTLERGSTIAREMAAGEVSSLIVAKRKSIGIRETH